jgi:BirA family biotin operon repressor/biotin-[acetyl-CoA-carboxylase] ligase
MSGAAPPPPTPELPPGMTLVALDTVDSTNAEARRRAEDGAPDGTVVWATQQTQGRGRRGRAWASPPGNLYISLLLRPATDLARASQLGFAGALALVEALGPLLPTDAAPRVKWPNDVLVNDRKVAGLLLESVLDGQGGLRALVLGIGVNVASAPVAGEPRFPATSLCAEGAPETLRPADLLAGFAPRFAAWTARWREQGFPALRTAWLRQARGVGEPIEVRLPESTRHGTFRDLDETGALLLDTGTGPPERIHVGDVFFGER